MGGATEREVIGEFLDELQDTFLVDQKLKIPGLCLFGLYVSKKSRELGDLLM